MQLKNSVKLYVCVLLSLVVSAAYAQPPTLRGLLDEAYQARLLSDYSRNITLLRAAESLGEGNQSKTQWAELIMELTKHYLVEAQYDSAKHFVAQAHQRIGTAAPPAAHAYYHLTQATYYNYLDIGELAIENAQQALRAIRQEEYPALRARANYILYGVYSTWDNVALCEKYIQQAIENAQQAEDYELLANSYNGKSVVMEYHFKKEGDEVYRDSIPYFLQRSLETYRLHPKQVAVRTYAITNTNLANYFFKYHTIQRAATQDSILRYARAAKSAYEPFDRNYDILANVNGLMAEVAAVRGDLKTAERYLMDAYTRLNAVEFPSNYNLVNVSQGLIDVYLKSGEPDQAIELYKKKEEYRQRIFDASQVEQANKLESFYENQKLSLEVREAEQLASSRRIQLFLLIAVCVFLIAGLWFLRNSFRNKHKLQLERNLRLREQQEDLEQQNRLQAKLQEEAKARLLSEQKLLNMQIEQMQRESMAGALQIERKNRLLLQLREKLKKLETQENTGFIDRMIREELRLEERVEQSVKEFENIHPDFFKKLKAQSADRLTALELKHCAYIHLKLSTKEIAAAFHIEPKSVRTSKYRIKQKLNLDKQVDLDNYLQELH